MRRDHNVNPSIIDNDTLLLFHGDSFSNQSALTGVSVTNVGGVESVSGGYFDKAWYWSNSRSGYIQVDMGTSNKITNGIWTLDLWVKPLNVTKTYKCVADFCATTLIMYFDMSDSRDGTMACMGGNGQSWNTAGTKLWPNAPYVDFTANTWTHIAICADGTNSYYFKDGVLKHTIQSVMKMSDGKVRFGEISAIVSGRYFRGYMSEIRLSKVCRWTSNFTPPTQPY